MSTITDAPPGWRRRVLWFAGLYAGGLGVTFGVAWALRLILIP